VIGDQVAMCLISVVVIAAAVLAMIFWAVAWLLAECCRQVAKFRARWSGRLQ
jgi:hypothetical protein